MFVYGPFRTKLSMFDKICWGLKSWKINAKFRQNFLMTFVLAPQYILVLVYWFRKTYRNIFVGLLQPYLSHLMTKPTKWHVCPCAPSEDSGQPGHPPSLIRVFAVPMKKAWVLSYPLSGWPGWSESSLGAQSFCWFCHKAAHLENDLDLNICQVMTLDSYNTVDRCFTIYIFELMYVNFSILFMSPAKRICVFEHSVITNFNCACPAIQRGQGSGFLSEGPSWLTACISEQRRFWRDCADAQAGLNLRCSHRR